MFDIYFPFEIFRKENKGVTGFRYYVSDEVKYNIKIMP